jgi:hypothetical protein
MKSESYAQASEVDDAQDAGMQGALDLTPCDQTFPILDLVRPRPKEWHHDFLHGFEDPRGSSTLMEVCIGINVRVVLIRTS